MEEGGRRLLDLSLLQATDLDVPEDELRFSVLRAPRHGSITRYGRRGAGPPQPVLHFTLQDLQNGRWAQSEQALAGRSSQPDEGVALQVWTWRTRMTTRRRRRTASSCD